jgi:hypothetical protein
MPISSNIAVESFTALSLLAFARRYTPNTAEIICGIRAGKRIMFEHIPPAMRMGAAGSRVKMEILRTKRWISDGGETLGEDMVGECGLGMNEELWDGRFLTLKMVCV